MLRNRLVFAALLLTAPLLHTQQTQAGSVKAGATHAAAAAVGRAAQPTFEPLRITITFTKYRHDTTTTERIYTLSASSLQANPQIRDDRRVPVKKQNGDAIPTQYFDSNTDVDVENIRMVKKFVSLTLRISTDRIGDGSSSELPSGNEVLSADRYTISPTVPIGKQLTVYSMETRLNGGRVEISLLVEPLNEK
jgi:hypothetical protein